MQKASAVKDHWMVDYLATKLKALEPALKAETGQLSALPGLISCTELQTTFLFVSILLVALAGFLFLRSRSLALELDFSLAALVSLLPSNRWSVAAGAVSWRHFPGKLHVRWRLACWHHRL